jgi:Zn-dependent protease with chaperone function
VHTSILHGGRTHDIDLSGVGLADIYAALIGREISHINRHHFGALTLFRLMTFTTLCVGLEFLPLELVTLPVYAVRDVVRVVMEALFAQQCEYEADEDSMIMLYNAGYNPLGLLWLLEYDARRDSWLRAAWRVCFSISPHTSPPRAWRQANLLQLVTQLCHAPDGCEPTRIAYI